jgi:hypothetical protein
MDAVVEIELSNSSFPLEQPSSYEGKVMVSLSRSSLRYSEALLPATGAKEVLFAKEVCDSSGDDGAFELADDEIGLLSSTG